MADLESSLNASDVSGNGTVDGPSRISRLSGWVSWFSTLKGYGIIEGEDGSEYFVRQENIVVDGLRELETGQNVEFYLGTDDEGKVEAKGVRPI